MRARFAIAFVLLVATPARALPPGPDGDAIRAANVAIAELRLEDAERELATLSTVHADDPDALMVRSLLAYHRGDYAVAVTRMERSLSLAPADDDGRVELLDQMQRTRETITGFQTRRSQDGRFVVRFRDEDRVLVPIALRALQAADARLTETLGYRHPGPVRLELVPSPATLARLSTLTVEAIERTGTIALCKWDKLMVTSPRALVRGYAWVDTIAHEYVHLVLARASRDHAPVWLQEGFAKLLERRWRGEPVRASLDPSGESLLRSARIENRLLPFDRIHPSIALLPSQEDATLAFAQVATFVETFHGRHGDEGLRAVIAKLAAGEDARAALSDVASTDWDQLERQWRAAIATRPDPGEAPAIRRLRFRRGSSDPDESLEVTERARGALRLGDLLWERRRYGAAAHEYRRAHSAAPTDPIVATRLARASLQSGDGPGAVTAIETVLSRFPEHAPARALLSAALLAKGDRGRARAEAREATWLNPFDPEPHCVLAEVDASEEARTNCEQLR